jgi:hypothetical protein
MFSSKPVVGGGGGRDHEARSPLRPFFNVVRPPMTFAMQDDVLFERWKRRQKMARNSAAVK